MRKKIEKIVIFLFVSYSLFFFLVAILSPIMTYFEKFELSAKLTAMFMFSCHQQPDRSFWLLGYPVALCCRCLGFYLGVIVSGILELFDKLNIKLKLFLIFSAISLIDIFINYGLGIRVHNTGNITRFIVGIIMGLLFVVILQYLLKGKRKYG